MKPRDFLTISDLSRQELAALLRRAARCKRRRAFGGRLLSGKTVALVFQKPSVRTRVSFEVAIGQLGGSSTYLGHGDVQVGTREPVKDVARTLSRYVDGIVLRTFGHGVVEEFARYAWVPVINGLSDLHHPCQALADLLTVQERFGRLRGVTIAYVGDGNNVLHSLLEAAGLSGMHVRAATPKGYEPDWGVWKEALALSPDHVTFDFSHDPRRAVRGADVIYTDVWASMGREHERAARLKAFRGFQVNGRLVSGAKQGAIVLHCLPAHRGEEITEDVLESRRSLVFEQAENRLHVQKALLMMLLGKGRKT
jgi:ornithine carbamoyltransferase